MVRMIRSCISTLWSYKSALEIEFKCDVAAAAVQGQSDLVAALYCKLRSIAVSSLWSFLLRVMAPVTESVCDEAANDVFNIFWKGEHVGPAE